MPHKLLLADDSVTIQRVIELTFAEEDMQVVVVGDGQQAIDRIRADRPDIVLADVGMPERDGYDVAAFVKNSPEYAHIPVVLLTGAFEPVDEARARTIGCDAVLVKPFEPQMVINRVRELLSNRRAPAVTQPVRSARQPDAVGVPAASGEIVQDRASGDAVDDYFERLDLAFARLSAAPRTQVAAAATPGAPEAAHAPAERPPDRDPDPAGDRPPVHPQLAHAFAALLAVEQGSRLPEHAAPEPAVALSDEAIEDIVRRVLARLADDAMRALVLETAERLVREEIDRIKRS